MKQIVLGSADSVLSAQCLLLQVFLQRLFAHFQLKKGICQYCSRDKDLCSAKDTYFLK